MASFKQNKHSPMEFLHTDLLYDVFSSLPCKTIVVCKCVCKAWYNLLSHPNFSRHYAKNPPFTSIFLFKHLCVDNTSYAFLLEIAADGRVIKTPLTTNIPNFYLDLHLMATAAQMRKSHIIGSCNGLLFFYQRRKAFDSFDEIQRVYCYNPFTGECALLAAREWLWEAKGPVQYRIGYNWSIDKIKLLAFVNTNTRPACILTVGIDYRWRELEHPLYHFELQGVSFNGVYHWINGNTYPTCLKTFDFGEEKIGPEWKLPHDLAQGRPIIRLTVLNNHISVIENLGNDGFVVWTMKEYGVAESWSRKMVIGDFCLPDIRATLTNGDLLFSNDNGDVFTLVGEEKEDIKINVYKSKFKTILGRLYVAEFAPMFCSLNHCWNIQNV